MIVYFKAKTTETIAVSRHVGDDINNKMQNQVKKFIKSHSNFYAPMIRAVGKSENPGVPVLMWWA